MLLVMAAVVLPIYLGQIDFSFYSAAEKKLAKLKDKVTKKQAKKAAAVLAVVDAERSGRCTFFAWNSSSNCFAAASAASLFCFAMACCTWDWLQLPPDMAPAMAPIMPAAIAEPCSIFFRVPLRISLLSCSARNWVRTPSLVYEHNYPKAYH
jgi:hypothetical protein